MRMSEASRIYAFPSNSHVPVLDEFAAVLPSAKIMRISQTWAASEFSALW